MLSQPARASTANAPAVLTPVAFNCTQAMIRLTCNDRDAKITLDFGKQFTDRDAIRDVLNRLQSAGTNAAPTNNTAPNASQQTVPAQKPAPPPPPPPKQISPEEQAWRQKLIARKEVRRLHSKLVRGGGVPDDMFWTGMKYRYKPSGEPRKAEQAEDDIEETQRGVPSDAFTSGANCAMDSTTWEGAVPTPTQRHLVFMEHPAVARALTAKVPAEMSEETFWEHFLSSSMATRKRRGYAGRLSKTDAVRTAEADAVFAAFQAYERETSEREELARAKGLAMAIDMDRFDDHRTAHVMEGHVVGGDAPREMKKRKLGGLPASGSLGLMRQLNRHGSLIVDDTMEKKGPWLPDDEDKGRPLVDLLGEQKREFAKLDVSVSVTQGAADGKRSVGGVIGNVDEFVNAAAGWRPNVERFGSTITGSSVTLNNLLASMRP